MKEANGAGSPELAAPAPAAALPAPTAPSMFGVGEVPVRGMALTSAPASDAHGCPIEGEPGHESCAICGHPFPDREPAPLEEAVREVGTHVSGPLNSTRFTDCCGLAVSRGAERCPGCKAALAARGMGGE